ncbi:hypothetical protein GPECTOR_17g772 [Gonium pectorale]|uniref:Integrase catalytic domain-containing protein n=1 Tax=Gonium pectorale TaxID=33097 RepID=A0A150GJZ1_GONPE|nr:hypothetical protein GPECTOR_17g772 [Gonium pectorale]|eukprot:KXZ50136.1 hypothetical protein GPECTOR_17g772 [Gonium pectorale]
MVAIEHFSKWIELVPLPNKSAQSTAAAFLDNVLSRFSAPAEVLTDRGTEWQGEFAELLEQCLIDHRETSAEHPQTDGAAERIVQMPVRRDAVLRVVDVYDNGVATLMGRCGTERKEHAPVPEPKIFPSAREKRRAKEAEKLEGSVVRRSLRDPKTLRPRKVVGVIVGNTGEEGMSAVTVKYGDGTCELLDLAPAKRLVLGDVDACVAMSALRTDKDKDRDRATPSSTPARNPTHMGDDTLARKLTA